MVPTKCFNNTPKILDGIHAASKFLLAEYHRISCHASNETVVNEIRQTYYIIGLRRMLKSLTSKCIVCRIRRAKPQNPQMAPLPASRVAERQRPFSRRCIDYFGPLLVKIGRRREKRWRVLFTCLTTRAIHLELAHSLITSSVIMALQKLAARRGQHIIYRNRAFNKLETSHAYVIRSAR